MVECGPIKTRRDAFDPEQLMNHHMNMRTNQGLFGSYHPNDLVESIVEYFSRGGPQSMNSNQWGLAVYNPNDRIGQYMSNMVSPGNLGPQSLDKTNEKETVSQAAAGPAFNPDTLNQRLMQNALSKGNQFSNFVSPSAQASGKGSENLGFNADALNRQMMESTINQVNNGETDKETTTQSADNNKNNSTEQNIAPDTQSPMFGFNPDTLNAGLLNSVHGNANEKNSAGNPNQGQTRTMMLGFNPDTLNAGLISSIGYNPNSAMGKMPTYMGNHEGSGETVHGEAPGVSDNQENSSGSVANGMTHANSDTTENKHGGHSQSQTQVNGAGTGLPFKSNVENVQGSTSSMYNVNKSGTLSGGMMGNTSAGRIGSQEFANQNSGMPPGISAETVHQTETAAVKVHGIGGMS